MSQLSKIPASAYTPEMETLGAIPDIPTFDSEPVPVSRNSLTSGTRPLQLLPLPGTEFPVCDETSWMRGFQTENKGDPAVLVCLRDLGQVGSFNWATLALAHLYHGLDVWTRGSGELNWQFIRPLEVWAYEYHIYPSGPSGDTPTESRWIPRYLAHCHHTYASTEDPEYWRSFLNDRSLSDLLLTPWEGEAWSTYPAATPAGSAGVILGDVPFPPGMEVVLDPGLGLGSAIIILADLRQAPPPVQLDPEHTTHVPAQRYQELCQRFRFTRSFIGRLYSERHERDLEIERLRRHQSRQFGAMARLQMEVDRLRTRLEVEGISLDFFEEDDDGSSFDDAPPSPPPQAAAGPSRRRR
ncbi:hypothetical protein JCGZ_22316 [Jatropha curcas]|uniref:Aminotransferase-like plant mobile domain-containing protein n=1 Tax=Jatropha curcas TaxID=180498 RepID=A0A067JR05_JATCU|nr:hypothetical protein JCGZ_22316 [Jatropha curcas]